MKIGQAAAAIIGQAFKTGCSAATQRTETAAASTLANASSRISKPAAGGSPVRHNIPPASQGDIFGSVARHFSAKAAGGSALKGLTQTLAKLGDTPKPQAIQLLSEGKNWSEMTKNVIDAMNTTMPLIAKPGLESTDKIRDPGPIQEEQMQSLYDKGRDATPAAERKSLPTFFSDAPASKQAALMGQGKLIELHEKLDAKKDSMDPAVHARINNTLNTKFDSVGVGLILLATRPIDSPGLEVNGIYAGDFGADTPEEHVASLQAFTGVLNAMITEMTEPDIAKALFHLGDYEIEGTYVIEDGERFEKMVRTTDLNPETTTMLENAAKTGSAGDTFELGHIGFSYAGPLDHNAPTYNGKFELRIVDKGKVAALVHGISMSPDRENMLPDDAKLKITSIVPRGGEKYTVEAETLQK